MIRVRSFLAVLSSMIVVASVSAAELNVKDFGAKADGSTDNTAVIQKALDTCAAQGGGRVFVPAGEYLVAGHLNVPPNVILAGIAEAPSTVIDRTNPHKPGSVLLATEGKGHVGGAAFITLHDNAQITGLSVYYPDQTPDIIPYPWCVRGDGSNCSITNCLLINPYQGVDFGTIPGGRHFINGLYGQPLKTGIFIDQCYDVGKIENVHFWPFWTKNPKVKAWTREHGEAFVIGRTDWEYMHECFCIFYHVGYHFVDLGHAPGNAVLDECGSDIGPLSVRVDAVQPHAGVSFVNGQFMCGLEVSSTNKGPVKFTNCGFWGNQHETDNAATIAGTGTVTFTACHFISWAQVHPDAAAILV
ncbi:MAG TPA: glycosyl hydrolase family 28-related protein, partial [Tepidisphaeraceae bacterium]|nr:glycosyl hydrolase family 28-related protein [Tepidisphaeraceae bacterium]